MANNFLIGSKWQVAKIFRAHHLNQNVRIRDKTIILQVDDSLQPEVRSFRCLPLKGVNTPSIPFWVSINHCRNSGSPRQLEPRWTLWIQITSQVTNFPDSFSKDGWAELQITLCLVYLDVMYIIATSNGVAKKCQSAQFVFKSNASVYSFLSTM